MIRLFLFAVILCSEASIALVQDTSPNLPPVGASLFDKVFSKETKSRDVVYDVPRSPSEIIQKLKTYNASVAYTLYPFSRSLQRPRDLSYDPLLNPRLVFATTFSSFDGRVNPIFPMKMFFGYVKATDQMEVISYNDEAGRFEFQIVKDLSKNPKVYYADRNKCVTCHQNQAPIFARADWPDSTNGFAGELVLAKLGLSNDDNSYAQATHVLFGGKWGEPSLPEIDTSVNFADGVIVDQQGWLFGCGKDSACRLGMLLDFFAADIPQSKEYIENARHILEAKSYQRYTSSFSSDHFIQSLFNVVAKYKTEAEAVNSPEGVLAMIDTIYNLDPSENPATPRLIRWPGALWATSLLRSDKGFIEDIPHAKLADALIRLYQKKSQIFDERVLNSTQVMSALLTEVQSDKAKNYQPWLNKKAPKPALYAEPLPPVFEDNRLNRFSRHCAECHAAGGTSYPPQFLFGSEEQVVKNIAALKQRITFQLKNEAMPPTEEKRAVLQTSGDYDVLLQYLQEIE